jgi:hypothetical protein
MGFREAHRRPRRRRRHLVWLRTWNWWDRQASTLAWSIVQNMVLVDNDTVPALGMGRDSAAALAQLRELRDQNPPFQSEAAIVPRVPQIALVTIGHILRQQCFTRLAGPRYDTFGWTTSSNDTGIAKCNVTCTPGPACARIWGRSMHRKIVLLDSVLHSLTTSAELRRACAEKKRWLHSLGVRYPSHPSVTSAVACF